MKSLTEIRLDNIHLPPTRLGGQARFVILILAFNILLLSTLILALRQGELRREFVTLEATRTVYEELIRTETITHTQIITRIIPYGTQP
jgi:hypothetical protein